MSWSVTASGQLEAVKEEIERQFDRIIDCKCVTDAEEMSHMSAIRSLIEKALSAFGDNTGVSVSANGSLSSFPSKQHSITLSLSPIWNWVEKKL